MNTLHGTAEANLQLAFYEQHQCLSSTLTAAKPCRYCYMNPDEAKAACEAPEEVCIALSSLKPVLKLVKLTTHVIA